MRGWRGPIVFATGVLIVSHAQAQTGASSTAGIPNRHLGAFYKACTQKDTRAQCKCWIREHGKTRDGRFMLDGLGLWAITPTPSQAEKNALRLRHGMTERQAKAAADRMQAAMPAMIKRCA